MVHVLWIPVSLFFLTLQGISILILYYLVSPADRQNRVSIAFLTNEHKVNFIVHVYLKKRYQYELL